MPKTNSSKSHAIEVLRDAANKWPSRILTRRQIAVFSGGTVAVGTIANEASRGTGPKNGFRVGRQVAYPIDDVVEWLVSKVEA